MLAQSTGCQGYFSNFKSRAKGKFFGPLTVIRIHLPRQIQFALKLSGAEAHVIESIKGFCPEINPDLLVDHEALGQGKTAEALNRLTRYLCRVTDSERLRACVLNRDRPGSGIVACALSRDRQRAERRMCPPRLAAKQKGRSGIDLSLANGRNDILKVLTVALRYCDISRVLESVGQSVLFKFWDFVYPELPASHDHNDGASRDRRLNEAKPIFLRIEAKTRTEAPRVVREILYTE